jgi:hypothetical protein
MKVTIEFENDEADRARLAIAADTMYSALHDIVYSHIRTYFKYTEGGQEAAEKVLEAIRDEALAALPREE